ncbi:MAG TPA: DUF4347 domain-containing protein, partial [Victivallales bacterium]|nr:DUF4347 domain-containing protein [Victivallales bacterium]
MYQLEDRVLFDGAAVADIDAAQQEQQNQESNNQAVNNESSESSNTNEQNVHESSDILNPGTESVFSQPSEATDSSVSGTTEATAEAVDSRVNVLVVSDSLENADALFESANSSTLVVRYNADTTTASELLDQISEALNGEKADTIGFLTDKADNGSLDIFADGETSADNLSSDVQKNFWNGVEGLLSEDGRIDIFASDLASTDSGRELVDALADLTDHK